MRQLGSTDLKRLHRTWQRQTEGRVRLVADAIQSPFNVGAILRTAAAFRVETVYVTPSTANVADSRSQRLAMGTDRYLEIVKSADVNAALSDARADGYRVIAIELADGALPLHQIDLRGDVCLVLGNEDQGLRKDVLEGADAVGFIPQLGKVGSLNVATAAAIAMYEARRQCWPT